MFTMETSTVARLVEYFNNALIVAVALFAVFGAVVIFWRKVLRVDASGGKTAKQQKNGKKSDYALFFAFCFAALAAFALEAAFFNFQPYLKFFAGPEIETTDVSPEHPNILKTTGNVSAEILTETDEKTNLTNAGLRFKDLNMKVTSIFVQVEFNNAEVVEMIVQWTDGLSNANSFTKKLYKYIPRENYAPLQPYGNVSELKIMFSGTKNVEGTIDISSIALNKRIPFYFSGLRLLVVSFLLFALICFFKKEPRARAAYYLFEYKFNPASRQQNIIYALTVVLLILFSYLCINTSHPKSYFDYPVHQQYNKYLVDAIMEGRTWLNYGTPENLLKAERPYDNAYRIANGYKFNADVMWDWAWYKGKFYCYYGVVPAVILYLPYKLITGEYLSNNGGIFVFTVFIIILMALLWRFCVKKYMPNAGFAFYMLSFFTLFFASGIFVQLRYIRFYSIAQTSGLMFALAGFLLLLKSTENEKINRLKLFFACLCLALIAGCRPTMIFASALVPIVLWKYRSWKLLSFVAIPYAIVAIPLCVYNYVRFDSIFEFGINYTLGAYNSGGTKLIVPFGKIIQVFMAFTCFLFAPGKYSLYFPFVEGYPLKDAYVMGMYLQNQPGVGLVNFPIVFCLLYLFKDIVNKKQAAQLGTPQRNAARHILWGGIIVAAITVICDSVMVGFQGRYLLDFAFFIILPSLFCAYSWCANPDNTLQNKNHWGLVYALLAISIFVGLFLCVTGVFVAGIAGEMFYNDVLYRYLEYSLGILRNV
jgi:hypothetical protein